MPEITAEQIDGELTALAARLFDEGKVEYFLAYQKATVPFKTTPLIARQKEDLRSIWVGDYFIPNLSTYLKEIRGKVGIVVKGCDSRSLISLLKEEQIKREDLFIVGISCPGQIDTRKLTGAAGCEPEEAEEIIRRGPEIVVRTKGVDKSFPRSQALFDKCLRCEYPKPLLSDVLLPGEYVSPVQGETDPAGFPRENLKGKTLAERWTFWARQFERCIRCYACRNVCPACFCPRCVVEENMPQWVSPLPTRGENFIFHIMRLMHVTGTCTACGECERVCPMEIPLMKLNEIMAADLKDLFDFVPGVDVEKALPLRTYRQEDPNDLFK